jgi:DNA polymerase V
MTAVEKMRHHRLAARSLTVFAETNKFQPGDYYSNSYTYKSAYPSDNLFEIQHWATKSLKEIYRENLAYKKTDVILGGLIPAEARTARLYENQNPKHEKLNKVIDEINKKFGKGTVHLAIAHTGKWQMKRERMSPRYTTRIDEVMNIL